MTSRFTACLLAGILAGTLAGCGFQLRGAEVLPPGQGLLYVSGPSDILQEIGVFLDGSDTQLLRTPAGADVVLNIASAVFDRRVLSVDPNTGKEREFELAYSVRFSARGRDGSQIVAPQNITLLRDFVFDSDAVIGKSREEHVLRTEMVRDAAQQILYRLQSARSG